MIALPKATCILLLLLTFPTVSAFVNHGARLPRGGGARCRRTAGLRADPADEGTSNAPAAASTPSADAAGLTRSQVIRGASVVGYGTLLGAIFTAESSPAYVRAVGRAINGAVPRSGLNVLEVGYGTGPNLETYPKGTRLMALDAALQDADSRAYDEYRARRAGLRVGFTQGDAAQMPFADASFDAVVMIKTLCSVDDPEGVLREVSRVLKPGGRFGFVEHVAAASGSALETSQLLLDPVQQAVAGRCHLHRSTDALVAQSVQAGLFERVEAPVERYIVPRMWPISQQASGVVVR